MPPSLWWLEWHSRSKPGDGFLVMLRSISNQAGRGDLARED